MRIDEQIKYAETEINLIKEHRTNGDPFQQKRAIQSLLEIFKTLSSKIDELEYEINGLKMEINGLKTKDEN